MKMTKNNIPDLEEYEKLILYNKKVMHPLRWAKHYPPLIDGESNRFLLNFGIDSHGRISSREISDSIIINGYVSWPNNSGFLQILEKFRFQNKISMEDIDTFFECGTAAAQTAMAMSAYYNVITVEFLEELHTENTMKRGLKYPIDFRLGDGKKELKKYLINNPEKRLLILLDDHDPDYNAWILEQLSIIKTHSNRNDHIILVDDFNCFGMGTYPRDFAEFSSAVKEINPRYIIEDSNMRDIIPPQYCYIIYPEL
jgi:hypothetical protein